MVIFGPLAAEIVSLVWGTPGNFNGFRVLAALLQHSSSGSQPNCGVEQRALPIFGRARWALAHISSYILSYCIHLEWVEIDRHFKFGVQIII